MISRIDRFIKLSGVLALALSVYAYGTDKPPLSEDDLQFLLSYEKWYSEAAQVHPAPKAPKPAETISHEHLVRHLKRLLSDSSPRAAEDISRALRACLLYMRAQNNARSIESVNMLHYWKHSEHFLEYRPALFLIELVRLRWCVQDSQLRRAITKLESLLPTTESDMIDCAAGKPLAHLLQLLAQQEQHAAISEIERFMDSPDPHISYAAQCAILELNRLPIPTLRNLVQGLWGIYDESQLEILSDEQRLIALGIAVHEGAKTGTFAPWLSAEMIMQTAALWKEQGYDLHAAAVLLYMNEDQSKLNEDMEQRLQAQDTYLRIEKKAPISAIAKQLIENSQLILPL